MLVLKRRFNYLFCHKSKLDTEIISAVLLPPVKTRWLNVLQKYCITEIGIDYVKSLMLKEIEGLVLQHTQSQRLKDNPTTIIELLLHNTLNISIN